MLAPRDRSLLLESLRPPLGYRLDQAVGTSYSLDLLALLTAPLAFTFFDWEDEEGRPSDDPLALLEAVRRNAERIHLFCQAGAMHAPADGHPLFAWLERCVHEVTAPRGGVFHPKLWVLRYVGEDWEPVRYRVVVLTRNLTFDQSWDTVLVLDGELGTRKRALASMRPLADMVAALPDLAVRPVSDGCADAVERIAAEIGRVELELPEGFKELRFHPLGMTARKDKWLFGFGWRRLVISPFLSEGFLKRFAGDREECILISRSESLLQISDEVRGLFGDCYTLAAEADPEEGEEDHQAPDQLEAVPSGLHAKLFIIENGRRAHLFTGSANATEAAFSRNVEILVELVGGKWKLGIPALLESKEPGTLRDLLEEWVPTEEAVVDPEAEIVQRLDQRLEVARRLLAGATLRFEAAPVEEDSFDLTLRGALPELAGIAKVRLWPATIPQAHGRDLEVPAGGDADHELSCFRVVLQSITAFLSLELTARENGLERRIRFSLCLPLVGAPEDREQRILHALLKDKGTVLRLLYLLLSGEEISVAEFAETAGGNGSTSRWNGGLGFPLLEAMVRALDRNPSALEPVRRLIEDLQRNEKGRRLLPDGFERVWDPVRAMAEKLSK